MPDEMSMQPTGGGYSNGEVKALMAPCLGLDPEEVEHIFTFAILKDGNVVAGGGKLIEIYSVTMAYFGKIVQVAERMMEDAARAAGHDFEGEGG